MNLFLKVKYLNLLLIILFIYYKKKCLLNFPQYQDKKVIFIIYSSIILTFTKKIVI